MTSARDGDHAMGLELQIEELVEQRARAMAQARHEDGAALEREIAALQLELASTVDPDPDAGTPVIRAETSAEATGPQ